ncbi:tetratricopeptide repeat protein 27 [Folsomia candida]|uniref:tetratricopeptide repeat protein 27 n=1 Tax=Folsomia candida TaxID=158441 RepID=UPI000B8F0DA8|nr:tetratricopeptide repeat protein 27 [Folsomia candida]XP_035703161.1 tetratricopeptide repeat protein 27 [Folsomia candida]
MARVPLTLSAMEINLLKGLPISLHDANTKSTLLQEILESFEAQADDSFVMMAYHLHHAVTNEIQSILDEQMVHQEERSEILLLISAKLIRLFVQLNSTGPHIKFTIDNSTSISLTTKTVLEELDAVTLQVDGLEINELAVLPQLLLMAQEFLKINSSCPNLWIGKMHAWWYIRAKFLQQKILDGTSVSVAGCIGTAAAVIETQFEIWDNDLDLKTLWYCEQSDIHLYYYDIVSARKCLSEAAKTCKSEFYTTGMLGKKTKFQQNDLAQLVVQADMQQVTETTENTIYLDQFRKCRSVIDVPLDDDTRLEKVKLQDESRAFNLTTIQQVLLLAELNYMKKSQAKDELLKEQILAYVRTLLEDPKLWNVFVVSLIFRSMVETDHFRTVERSMMQFENIQRSVTTDVSPSFSARYQFYHASCMPLTWEIDVAFGDVLISLGHIKNALDVYLRINMWENVIACYNSLDLKHKAEEVIREQIKKTGETQKLLVYLGDATNDITLYDKAWELSNHKSFLSRQRLGVYWFRKQQYEKAIPFLKAAVELNPLEYPVWVRLAYAALHSENWELCVKAYVHANNLDDQSFENWNNLAKAALKLGNKDQALRALKQATKCNYEEWKVWENLMVVALQCCDLEWTIMAFNRLIDLKDSYADDMVLRLLVDLVCDDSWDAKGATSARSRDALQKLLGRVTSKVTTNADVWQSYSTFLYKTVKSKLGDNSLEDKWYNMVQYQQKTVKCRIQNTNWDKIPDLTKHVVEAIELLCTRTREFLDVLPNNLSGKDLKTQAEFLNQRVQNTISQKCKEAIDPTIYTEFLSRLGNANHILTGGTVT